MTSTRASSTPPSPGGDVIVRKKLIEVALPLDEINVASAREKSIRHGHPSTLHLWWARRPLAAARAVIFSQMVDDPSTYVDVLLADPKLRRRAESVLKARRKVWEEARATGEKAAKAGISPPVPGSEPQLAEIAAEIERERLFAIIRELVKWENTTNERVLQAARDEIWASWRRTCADNADHPRAKELFDRHRLPGFHDPFAGGGALPLEAQRLGLESYASDLNPVAVLINKAMIEIPPRFAGRPPVNPEARSDRNMFAREWKGVQGLAADVRYYGKWMRNEAVMRIEELYPPIEVTADMARSRPDLKPYVGRKLTVIAWLWVRTVKSPNPAFRNVDVPLASTFMLSTKTGKEAYVEPVVEDGGYRFMVKAGKPRNPEAAHNGTKLSRGAFKCLMSGSPFQYSYVDDEANAGRMSARLMAIVAAGDRERVYLPPTSEQELVARSATPRWKPDAPSRGTWASNAQGRQYGFRTFGDYYTPRQIVALTTFSDLVREARELAQRDAIAAGLPPDVKPVRDGGTGATAYGDAVALYLTFAVSKAADRNSSLCVWENQMGRIRGTFGRQAIPMTWDYAETNPFAGAGGDIYGTAHSLSEALDNFRSWIAGHALQQDARSQSVSTDKITSTDPPTTTTSVTRTSRTISMSGYGAHWEPCFPISSPPLRLQRSRSWLLRHTVMGAKKTRRDFSRWHDASHAAPRQPGQPSIPSNDLLRIQTDRNRRQRRDVEHWLGDLSRRGNSSWFRAQWNVAHEIRAGDSQYWPRY